MEALDIARWQFGIVTVYHFFFVPVTIGLSFLVAGLETAWIRTNDERYLKLTKFFGKLFLINFAIGVATGIVQEFQFGMNWSDYSRFVGDIFGAPLAIEGLLAFFLESTFLGLWIFGWDRLPKKIHAACIWIVGIGTLLSSFFILAANSFMQNPVGYTFNAARGRAELTDFGAVLGNKVLMATFPHQIFGCFMVGGAFMAGIALWHLMRRPNDDAVTVSAFRTAFKLGAVTLLVAGIGTIVSGDYQGKVMTEVQPMKMAAAEGLYQDRQPAPFSILTIGKLDGSKEVFSIKMPKLLSYLGTGHMDGKVRGIDSLQSEYEQKYGPGDYSPNIPIAYWNFRLMITAGGLAMVAGLWMMWSLRRGRIPTSKWMLRSAILLPFLPLVANSFGWIFTEMGRQPWAVFGLMPTAAGVSPGTTTGEVLTSLIAFTVLYGVLAVIEVRLMLTYIQGGLPEVAEANDDRERPLAFAY
ncbi:MAG: cytochrome ubiquinol oxidase subunit I [Aeromicrobium sp.]